MKTQASLSPLVPISYVRTPLHNPKLSEVPERIRKFISPQACENKSLTGKCWTWTGFCYQGYGRLRWPGFKTHKAHRIVYELFRGPIPEGLHTDHLCLNRSCVNPAHIEPVTRAENIRRSHTTGRGNGTRTTCIRGHQFSDSNTYVWRGKRFCRTCQGLHQKAWNLRKKVAADPFQGKPASPDRSQPRLFGGRSPANGDGAL